MEPQSRTPPSVAARNPGAFRVMGPPGTLSVPETFMSNPPPYPGPKANGSGAQPTYTSLLQAEREVEILNHCFDDIESFIGKLQRSAEAHTVLSQRKKKKKSRRKKDMEEDDLLTLRARPPPEEEFTDIFQKFKYAFSLLDRLKFSILNPDAEELLHHLFIALDLLVKTTGGPALGAGVSSPALTGGAVALLQDNLTDEEKQLWTSLGPNWTLSRSQLGAMDSPYTPVFLDEWKPQAFDPDGQLWEDPLELQHQQEAQKQRQTEAESDAQHKHRGHSSDEMESSSLPPEGERVYSCSYDFVARNSSELSVLQGETVEVIESSKRWWKCRNRYDQIGFVPFNILEPLSAVKNGAHKASALTHVPSKKSALSPLINTSFAYNLPSPSYISSSPTAMNSQSFPGTPTGEDGDRVMVVNDELLQRLTNGKAGSPRPMVIPRTSDTSAPLDYHSPSPEVAEWLSGKGFSKTTVDCLGVLTGAQLFSLNKEELRAVVPEEGARVYSQIMVQKALIEDKRKSTELEEVMEKQKMKVDLKMESSTL
ncbi:epidermal growth factor receptor kinase substrate 8-like protein 1a isoform X2 [Conger conger]|uniref:epidermal growth factor receptor kinase substrate 8-like protein 1a isoform X2 n=1 Tax=Conger conger TaxID=82655 RepID=UPI002A59EAF6|nr:epidermal growth factor receptor kinase substrate 8-like protein 1a isoform X2 [Conger conger]